MVGGSYVKFGCFFLFFSLLYLKSYGQYALQDFDLEGDIYAWHDEALGMEKAGIVVGSYQQIKRSSKDSYPFFATDSWESNQIRYKGETFEGIYLLYDVQEDVLVMRHPTELVYHSQAIKPIQEQVAWFTLAGHRFRYYPHQVLQVPPGFFDELYVGEDFDVIVKRVKDSRAESNRIVYVSSDVYVTRFRDEFFRLRRKGSVIRLFEKEQRKEIRQFIKTRGLKVNPDNEKDLVELAHFCDELLKKENR